MYRSIRKHTHWIWCICIDNGFIYSAFSDKTIIKWDDSGNCVSVLKGHTGGVMILASFKGYLLSGSNDNKIIKWMKGRLI